jgi:hypothetical protein
MSHSQIRQTSSVPLEVVFHDLMAALDRAAAASLAQAVLRAMFSPRK